MTLKGMTALTFDDEIDTGGTVANAAQALLEHGVKEVYCCASHPGAVPECAGNDGQERL